MKHYGATVTERLIFDTLDEAKDYVDKTINLFNYTTSYIIKPMSMKNKILLEITSIISAKEVEVLRLRHKLSYQDNDSREETLCKMFLKI